MNYEKMMLAAEVRRLAGVLHSEAFTAEKLRDQSVTNHSHWQSMNPVMSFAPAALAQLTKIADQISDSE